MHQLVEMSTEGHKEQLDNHQKQYQVILHKFNNQETLIKMDE